MKRRRSKAVKRQKPDKSPLRQFAKWWRDLPNSLKATPDLPPERRLEVEYLAFLHNFVERWRADQSSVLRELIEQAHVQEREVQAVLVAMTGWYRRTVLEFLKSDLAAMAKVPCGHPLHPLRRGGPFRCHLAKWLRECRHALGQTHRVPLIVPPSVYFGCNPVRQDLLPGVAPFGLWELSSLPWGDPANLALEALGDGRLRSDVALASRLSKELHERWLARAGSGPEAWLGYLRSEHESPVWVGWSLFRLVEFWQKSEPAALDQRFVSAHLLAVSNGYRAALRNCFDPSMPYRDGEGKLSDVYPLLDLGTLGPKFWVAPDGTQDYPKLHRLCSYLWYACARLASEVPLRAPRKVRKNRAWIEPALNYIEQNPNCTLRQIAHHVGVAVSTVSRNRKILRAREVLKAHLDKGHRNADGTVDAVVEDE